MTEQQTKDHELITNIWHMLRDYGDIQNDAPNAEARWSALLDYSEQITADKDDGGMTKFFVGRTLRALEDRTNGREIGADLRPEEEKELWKLYHGMNREKKAAMLVMARVIGGSR